MAFTTQEKNFISRQQQLAAEVLALAHRIEDEVLLYTSKDFGGAITNEDLAGVDSFAHITQSDMWNCVNALQAIVDGLNANDQAHAKSLNKMKG